jgi:hypothetical protein
VFDYVQDRKVPRGRRLGGVALGVAVHAVILIAAVVVPLLAFSDQLPEPPDMLAFVAPAPAPPPPPPPPAPATAIRSEDAAPDRQDDARRGHA